MLKGLFIAALVLVCLGVIAVSYIVPNIRVNKQSTDHGEQVRVETPFGSVHVNGRENAPVDLGDVPLYPGAERAGKGSGGAVVDLDWGGGEKHFAVAGTEFVTDDSISTVQDWYRNRLPDWHRSDKEMDHVEGGVRRVITINKRDGRTRIGIATIGGPEAN